ncbi:hypothetical protein CD351_07355 [Erythrobacter sp. KY5]|uniref:hemopexin repeat-containing protein n=1 Tax=Erythrobacter sp. KY5 TaxID=2011159 RepID=UPI000DBF0D36|nr:hemopexin repeat-containing protein [Erythrobacter sp. KY5]AWW74245.1 hypothetical protein CD351_07355 [Erythrobacter sp. KY5]
MSDHNITFIRQAEAHIDTNSPRSVVEKAIKICRDMAKDASNELSKIRLAGGGVGEGMDRVKRAYYDSFGRSFPIWFGWDDDNPEQMLQRLELRFNEIFQRIDKGLNIRCRPATGRRARGCADGYTAFQTLGSLRPRRFHLCPKWFNLEREKNSPLQVSQDHYRASIIAHELCHAIGGLGTKDQKDASKSTVYGEDRALAFAGAEPDRAYKSAENIEQFLVYRERVRTKTAAMIPLPKGNATGRYKGVPAFPDAAVNHPNGKIYFFKGDRYWRYDPAKNAVDHTNVRKIGKDGWQGVPTNLDAALLHPKNGKIYFFKGNRYWRFDPSAGIDRVDHDDVRTIGSSGWGGVRGDIDAAVVHPNGTHALFFYGPYYRTYRFGGSAGALMNLRDPRDGTQFPYLYGNFNAVVIDPASKNGHFFTAEHWQADNLAGHNTHFG